MSRLRLAGTVSIVPAAAPNAASLARRLGAEGATVVLTGDGVDETGDLVADLEQGPGRVAVFVDDSDVDALVEFVAELFPSTLET